MLNQGNNNFCKEIIAIGAKTPTFPHNNHQEFFSKLVGGWL
jgi:hypothetical protein